MNFIDRVRQLSSKTIYKLLSTDGFVLFAMSIVVVLATITSILGFTIYNFYRNSIQRELRLASIGIDNVLDEIFTESNRLMVYIGKQIVHSGGKDLTYINDLLKDTSGNEYKPKTLFYWKTVFDWVSPNYLQLVNTRGGVLNKPPDVSHRSYCIKSRYKPWAIQFSKPDFGVASGVWVIPAGTGITDDHGDFLGILSMGFNVDKLTSILSEKLAGEKVSFIILDDELNIILQSPDNLAPNSKATIPTELVKKFSSFFSKEEDIIQKPLVNNNILYSFYRKMSGYPFTILTGIQRDYYFKGFYTQVLLPIIELICIGIFSLILLYLFRHRILKLNNNSDKAMKEFIAKVNQKLHLQLDVILQYSQSLIRYHKGEIRVGINTERQLEFITHINNAALNIKNMSNYQLDLTKIDINSAIKDTVYIHTNLAYQKDITIKTEIDAKLPLIEADDFCIRQILMSLLFSSIEYTPNGGTIWITSNCSQTSYQEKVTLTIRDNGFGLNEEDRERISTKFSHNHYNGQIATDLNIKDIKNLIAKHQGTCEIVNTEGKGRMVTLSFYKTNNSLSAGNLSDVPFETLELTRI